MVTASLSPPPEPGFIDATTGMGACMLAFDWAHTPIGRPHTWPTPLKTLVGVMLGSAQPMFVVWGEARTLLYNDAYAEILQRKHPGALGRDFIAVWSELEEALRPIVAQAYGGRAVHMADITLMMERRGYIEETHFAFSYTPVRLDGEIGGFFCACTEITGQVLAERRRQEETQRQRRLFEQAPGFITILTGPDHRFEFVNQAYRRLFGDRDYIGRPAREVFAELTGQGFFQLLDQVYTSGERLVAEAAPIRVSRGAGPAQERFLDFIYEPVTDESGAVTGIFCEGHDVTERHLAQSALEASEARFRTALQIDTVGAIFFDMDGRLIDANDAFLRMAGHTRAQLDAGELSWRTLTPPEWMEDSEAAFAELKACGQTTPYEKEYVRPDGTRWWALFSATLLADGTGFEFVLDITERKRTEAHLELLVLELNHRVKNNLATVQSIAHQTLRNAGSPDEARRAFSNRIMAMASAHDILTREQWEGAGVAEVAHGVLDVLTDGGRRIAICGPDVRLIPSVALSLSMAFHELGTNAIKYGALSRPGGEVELAWSVLDDNTLCLTWTERGGPPVAAPSRRGFGSRLLERGLATELNGRVELRFEPLGLVCKIEAPLEPVRSAGLRPRPA